MAHELHMSDDGILRMRFVGDVGGQEMEAFYKDFAPFLETATEEKPLLVISDSTQAGKLSPKARKQLADLNRDPRIGLVGVLGARRYERVLISFVLKVTGRDNIRFFEKEEEARAWLKG